MMILGIVVSTMIAVALVVFAVEMNLYKKYQDRRKLPTRKAAPRETRGAPIAS